MDTPSHLSPVEVLVTLPFADNLLEYLRSLSPRLHFNIIPARRPEDVPAEVWNRVEVLYTDRVLPAPNQAPNLRWLQLHFAGIDFILDSPLVKKPGLTVTHLSGVHAIQTSEYVLMMLLALSHRLPDLIANQNRADWPRDRGERFLPRELHNSTVGIVGYGSIGRELARLLYPFGVHVLATKRDVMRPEDSGYAGDGLGDRNGDYFTRLYPVQALKSMLHECDFVVVVVPLTPETRGLIGAAEFEVMKPSAFLVDISRGGVIDHAALISALQEKRIAGAALDVFPEEPFPSNNPLWRLPNVLLTPHIAGISPYYNQRAVDLFAENLQRYLSDQPLLNRLDLQKGY